MNNEQQLFEQFAANRSEDAFARIVRLHLNLVFASAFRQLGDRGLAEEVTQSVFQTLADKAGTLRREGTVAGWLYQTTLNQSRQRLRSELRRQNREQVAAALASSLREGESTWAPLVPLLDEALLGLREKDRLALLLHYMEERPLREVGRVLGVGEDAARKRIKRVLEDLTSWFRKRGFAVPSATLISALSLSGMPSASAALIPAIVSVCVSAPAVSVGSLSILTLFQIMASTQFKVTLAVVALTIGITTPFLIRDVNQRASARDNTAGPVTAPAESDGQSNPAAGRLNAARGPNLTAVATAPPREKSVFERINEGDESLAFLSETEAEDFLQRNKTNAESLLAAYKVTQNVDYLRRAATNFLTDPAVLLRVAAHNAFPEDRRTWLDRFKQIDSENALAWYMSAADHLKNGRTDQALQEIKTAGEKTDFRDYVTEHMISLEEIYLASGRSVAEAKMLGMAAVELPHLAQMTEMSRTMAELVKQSQQAGDASSSEAVTRMGLTLAHRINEIQDGGNLLGEMVAARMEGNFLRQLAPDAKYPFIEWSVSERINALASREEAIRADSQFFSRWISEATATELISYFDRLKFYGESAALDWLKSRAAQ